MQDHAFGHRAAVGPGQVEHLDLATAELRCRIAGIGLAIAELREETGRLQASAGERHRAVAVLERPLAGEHGASGVDSDVAPQPTLVEKTLVAPVAPPQGYGHRFGSDPARPASPWAEPGIGIVDTARAVAPASMPGPVAVGGAETVGSVAESPVLEPALTWVPGPARPAAEAPAAPVSVVCSPGAPDLHRADGHMPSLWADGDDDDTAAFEAFFSAEIEPEPSQRWLLSE